MRIFPFSYTLSAFDTVLHKAYVFMANELTQLFDSFFTSISKEIISNYIFSDIKFILLITF